MALLLFRRAIMEDADTQMMMSTPGERPCPPEPRVPPPSEAPPETDEPADEEIGYGYGV
jgi:hypothetical protein